jgi:enoyl-CoA hydratase
MVKPPSADPDEVLVHDVSTGHGVVRVLTINRPEKRNAMNTLIIEMLGDQLVDADHDPSVLACILTGSGGVFSGGADTKEFASAPTPRPMVERARKLADLQLLPRTLGIPVIAAVSGATLGGGAALALACDMVVAGDDLALGFPELINGIIPVTVMAGLADVVGPRVAFDLITTGRFIGAQEAQQLGFVNRVVAATDVLDEAIGLATALAGIDPAAMRQTKRLFQLNRHLPVPYALDAGLAQFQDAASPAGQHH